MWQYGTLNIWMLLPTFRFLHAIFKARRSRLVLTLLVNSALLPRPLLCLSVLLYIFQSFIRHKGQRGKFCDYTWLNSFLLYILRFSRSFPVDSGFWRNQSTCKGSEGTFRGSLLSFLRQVNICMCLVWRLILIWTYVFQYLLSIGLVKR